MKISRLMTNDVQCCEATSTLEDAARLMWDNDIGAVPVVDGGGQVIGIVTDRDVCMAAYTQGRALREIPLIVAMSNHVVTCRPDEDTDQIVQRMAENQIRRVPVVDDAQRPIGMVSLNDLALAVEDGREVSAEEIASTLASICAHRPAMPAALL